MSDLIKLHFPRRETWIQFCLLIKPNAQRASEIQPHPEDFNRKHVRVFLPQVFRDNVSHDLWSQMLPKYEALFCLVSVTNWCRQEMLSGSSQARADIDVLNKMTQLPVLRDERPSQTSNQTDIHLLMSETAIVSITIWGNLTYPIG